MNTAFDPKNPRVHQAHEKRIFNHPPVIILNVILFSALLIGGIALLAFKMSIGWTLIGFSILPLMFIFWIKNALAEIPLGKSDDFTDLLSEDLLLSLKAQLTPAELVKVPAKNS